MTVQELGWVVIPVALVMLAMLGKVIFDYENIRLERNLYKDFYEMVERRSTAAGTNNKEESEVGKRMAPEETAREIIGWPDDYLRDAIDPNTLVSKIAAAIRQAVEEEREACAAICDENRLKLLEIVTRLANSGVSGSDICDYCLYCSWNNHEGNNIVHHDESCPIYKSMGVLGIPQPEQVKCPECGVLNWDNEMVWVGTQEEKDKIGHVPDEELRGEYVRGFCKECDEKHYEVEEEWMHAEIKKAESDVPDEELTSNTARGWRSSIVSRRGNSRGR